MISIILAVLLANPCMAPVKHVHHHTKLPEAPQQSCAAPVVQMCYRDADITPEPAPEIVPYYIDVPVVETTQGEGPWIETLDTFEWAGGGGVVQQFPTPPMPTPRATEPHHPSARPAPEIDATDAAAGLTLLAGGFLVWADRRRDRD